MSAEDLTSSRPPSQPQGSFGAVGPYCPRIPTLHEVLSNTAPPPWTFSAFTAYLSQNHCLETLEFTMDAERYRKKYDRLAVKTSGVPSTPDGAEGEEVRGLWRKLMNAYIIPNAPREVNLPSVVRDSLLSLPNQSSPPLPDELSVAVNVIYELMEESVLMPFINELFPSREAPSVGEGWNESDENLPMRMSLDESQPSSHPRRRASPPLSLIDLSTLPPLNRLSHLSHSGNKGRLGSPTGSGDGQLTDDSGSVSSPNKEPMTPPITPPSSDIGGSSPRSRNDNTWKKMMGRLGSKKKSTSRMGRIDDESSG